MRAYQQTWETLRSVGEVTLIADKSLHERIHKAVRKEAYADIRYQELVRHRKGKFYISRNWIGNSLTLRLVWTKQCNPPINLI